MRATPRQWVDEGERLVVCKSAEKYIGHEVVALGAFLLEGLGLHDFFEELLCFFGRELLRG